jgi:hypothetical protein
MAIAGAALLLGVPAQAARVCAWVVEENKPTDLDPSESERKLTLWLQSDNETDFTYQIGGEGIVMGDDKGNAANKGTFTLHPGEKDTPWSYGATLNPPGRIDVTVELRKTPADIFSDAPTPLYAKFVFRRNVPANERKPPATFMTRQCANLPNAQ